MRPPFPFLLEPDGGCGRLGCWRPYCQVVGVHFLWVLGERSWWYRTPEQAGVREVGAHQAGQSENQSGQ